MGACVSIEYKRADPAALRANVPADMRALPVWLLWKLVPNGDDKPKKIPYYTSGKKRQGKGGSRAEAYLDSPEDRAQLVSFEEAMGVYEGDTDDFMGPGAALGAIPKTEIILSGIDWDHSRRLDGTIAPVVREAIEITKSYSEVSPSQLGAKAFGTGNIGTEKTPALEIYSRGRYFTVTGDRISGDRLGDLTAAAEFSRQKMLEATKRQAAGNTSDIGSLTKGSRNNTLFSEVCSLRGRGVNEDDARIAFRDMAAKCIPPLGDRELKAIFDSAWSYAAGFPLTDLGNSERLVSRYGDNIRFLLGGGWYTYQGHRYVEDRSKRLITLMGDTARSIYTEAATAEQKDRRDALAAWAKQSESRNRIENAVALAAPRVSEPLEDYDADPNLIGLRNGVYDLSRDEFRAGRPDDRITLSMNVTYDAAAACPRWEGFQHEIHSTRVDLGDGEEMDEPALTADTLAMAADAEMVALKQRAWGYTLSGDTSEQKLFMPFGSGANGKTTEQNVVLELHGDYGRKIEPETLLVRNKGSANNDIARTRGARFIATVEVEDGGKLAESITKQLTGRDRLAARFLYKEHFEFKPTGKIWLATNHKPEIIGTDYAIWRRIVLIPYPVRFAGAQIDPHLEEKLMAETPGIFNWMLAGYRQWKQHGLKLPDVVANATKQYQEDMDRVGNFLREKCRYGADVAEFTKASDVYAAYDLWMRANGMRPLSAQKFYSKLETDHKLFKTKRGEMGYQRFSVLGF
jgi:P4 family phage/plasmid primase-like protien